MRAIKFKAWDMLKKEMLYFDGIFNQRPYTEHSTFPQYESSPQYHDLVIMQFTGLHDKNGKEIYEGDRLICTINGEPVGEPDRVQFKEGEFCLANRDRSLREWLYITEFAGKEVECNFIVDGNIYENPDLC